MLSSFAPWCAETCISASERESQKPHQGFAGQNPIPHRGIAWSKSTLALGLPEWAGKTASGPAVAANNGWQQGPDPVAVANTMRQYVKAQTSNCYNGFHQTTGGKVVQAFSAVALFPVASNSQNNQISLGAEILGKLSMVAGSNSAGGLFTAFLEGVTADVTTPAYILGTGADAGALMLCGAGAATSIVP